MYWEIPPFLGVALSLVVLYFVIDFLVHLPRVGRYSDRYILVTGCGQGFGHEAVRRLDLLGCHVFAGCRREESVVELRNTFSDRVHPILMDVSNRESVRQAFEYVTSILPKGTGLWAVVNNAAIADFLPMGLFTLPMYENILATNLIGAIDVTLTFLPLIKKARGRIVNVSSLAGRITHPMLVPYCVSKYGMEAFTDGLRRSLRPFGCKAVLVEPGFVRTYINDEETCVKKFEFFWRKAVSEGRIEIPVAADDAEKLLEKDKESLHRFFNQQLYSSVSNVIETYEHGLFAVTPRARYLIGVDTKMFLILQMLPEWLSDWATEIIAPKYRY